MRCRHACASFLSALFDMLLHILLCSAFDADRKTRRLPRKRRRRVKSPRRLRDLAECTTHSTFKILVRFVSIYLPAPLRAYSVARLIVCPACHILPQAPRKKQRPKRSRNAPRSPRARRNPSRHRRALKADFSTAFVAAAAAAAANLAASPRSHSSSLPLSTFPMVF